MQDLTPDTLWQTPRRRRSVRLRSYDYAQLGGYFVTICTHGRRCLFGEVLDGQVRLSEIGRVAEERWREIPTHFPHVALDAFTIMPNHIHGVLLITDVVGAKNLSPPASTPQFRTPSKTIGSVVRGFKIGVTKWCRQQTNIHTVWQRNYYEHVIRTEASLNRIRQYILENPQRWDVDRENPNVRNPEPEDAWRA